VSYNIIPPHGYLGLLAIKENQEEKSVSYVMFLYGYLCLSNYIGHLGKKLSRLYDISTLWATDIPIEPIEIIRNRLGKI
jgi:hypothetical protein